MATQSRTITDAGPATSRWHLNLRTVGGATLAVLLLRALLQAVALCVSAYAPRTPVEQQIGIAPGDAPLGQWLRRVLAAPWMRYDANWYQRIVDHGYRAGEGTAAFHPLYPLLAMPLDRLFGMPGLGLLAVSTVACAALCVVFARYVAATQGEDLAQPATWLLLVCPPAFALLAPYSESVFLALAVGALLAMRRERWLLAGLLGALAALTRQQGLALALPLAWGVWRAHRAGRARALDGAAALLPPLGYALFVAYRALAFNDLSGLAAARGPADFVYTLLISPSAETVAAGQRIAWPWVPLAAELRLIAASPVNYYMLIDLLLGWGAALVALAALRRMDALERLYTLTIVGLALCYNNGDLSPYMALPRHMLLAFPIAIALARWAGRRMRMYLLIEVGLLFNLFLAGLFVYRGWVP